MVCPTPPGAESHWIQTQSATLIGHTNPPSFPPPPGEGVLGLRPGLASQAPARGQVEAGLQSSSRCDAQTARQPPTLPGGQSQSFEPLYCSGIHTPPPREMLKSEKKILRTTTQGTESPDPCADGASIPLMLNVNKIGS